MAEISLDPFPDYINDREFLSSLNFIKESDKYIILGNLSNCKPKEKFIDNYLLRYKEGIRLVYDKEYVSNCAIPFNGGMRDFCRVTKLI